MKTPEEWVAEFNYGTDGIVCEGPSDTFLTEFIIKVQADAYHLGRLDGLRMGKETAMKTIKEVFGKPAEKV